MSSSGPLTCPRCGATYPLDERFCSECGMPLTYTGRAEQDPVTEAHGRARKVKPQYTGGELVRVAGGRNQAEAELIQNLLLEEGIPSILRRTRGFDVPDFLAAGPRDVLVSERAYETARQMLLEAEMVPESSPEGVPGAGSPARLFAWILAAVVAAFLIVWLLYLATG
jgi:ribosomal protein L37E